MGYSTSADWTCRCCKADVATTTQLGVLQPLKRKESPFQLSQFAQLLS